MPKIIDMEAVHDCLHRIRYRYRVSSPITKSVLAEFSDKEIFSTHVYDATHILPLAKVTFQIQHRGDKFLISGAFGLDYITVTYSKCDELDRFIVKIEELIGCLP